MATAREHGPSLRLCHLQKVHGVSAMLVMHQDWHDVFDDLEALAEVLVASQLPWVATVFYLRDMESDVVL